MPLTELVDLVNEWATLPRALDGRPPGTDRDTVALADDLHRVFAAAGPGERAALVTALLTRTGVHPTLIAPATHNDRPARRVTTAANTGPEEHGPEEHGPEEHGPEEHGPDPAETGYAVADLVPEHDLLVEAWVVADPAEARPASAALALRHQLAAHPGRIGVCADRQCADVYVDVSPAGRRRFCCLTCQNRARAEAFRRRGRQAAQVRHG
jgi:hypothetical protein